MPIYAETRREFRHRLSRSAFNDLIGVSGSLATPTVTAIHSAALMFAVAADVVGGEVSFWQGAGLSLAAGEAVGAARVITQATPISVPGTQGEVAVLLPWGVAPSTNSGWEIHKLFSRQMYEDAIDAAIRRAGRRQMLPAEEYFVGNSWLRNSAFDIWLAGTAAAPTGWTLAGTGATVARNAAFPYSGRYYASLSSALNEVASLAQSAIDWAKLAGQTVVLKAMVNIGTAARAFIRLNDGSSNNDSSDHPGVSGGDGAGLWRELTTGSITLPTAVTDVQASLRIKTGAAITAHIGKVWFDNPAQYQYPLDNRWAFIQDIYVEDLNNEWVPLPREWWYIEKDRSPRELGFIRDYYTPEGGKVYKIVGQQYPAIPTETDNLPVDPEYVFHRAAHNLFQQLPRSEGQSPGIARQAESWRIEADSWERRVGTKPLYGSRPVEDL